MKFLKVLSLFLFFLGSVSFAQAQKKESHEERKARYEKIETAKIAFITDKVKLTPEQAQRFWPVYKEHDKRRNELRRKGHSFREENLSALTDEQIQAGLENRLALREKEITLEKEYMDKYLKIISPRQLALFYRAEREFTKLLLERLQASNK